MIKWRLHTQSDKRKELSRIKIISAGGIIALIILGVLSLVLYLSADSSESIYGKPLTLAPDEVVKFLGRPRFDSSKFDEKDEFQKIGVEIWSIKDESSVLVKLGIQKNDIIATFNGMKIESVFDLLHALNENITPRGDVEVIRIEIIRDGNPLTLTYYAVD